MIPTDCNVSLCVIHKPQEWGGPGLRWAVEPEEKNIQWILRERVMPTDTESTCFDFKPSGRFLNRTQKHHISQKVEMLTT
jgi:hypothetical protein